ncbi:Short chain dehydrogenase [Aspergillus sclerotialis]|uniref:Short chain dehydrogenase n=1 Tax=Aspergillus sclerotialis TaxID=2070753 RepID=A0A3A2ZYK2_9EURO|nr:Short chain dehydrogenase [Aspergillus sclerotialis]
MPSYLITGASRGVGLSADSNNTVIGLVRDKPATEKKVKDELHARSNIYILQADITSYSALQARHNQTPGSYSSTNAPKQNAVAETAKITGGTLDYLIANAGLISHFDAYDPIGVLGNQPEVLEQGLLECFKVNVIGNIHLFNLFTPLILKGQAKKVIAISSGQADLELIPKFSIDLAAAYSISKAGLNMAVAKFSAQYAKDGVLFMSICPGVVETGQFTSATEEQMKSLSGMFAKFVEYAPHFKGPSTPESAARDVISVMHKASVEKGDGGSFVSHFGNKQWI